MRKTLLFVVALFAATHVFAADEMRKLDFLVGDWKGEATVQMGPGKTEHVVQTESVKSKLGGKVLLIEGLGKRKNADGSLGEVVHDALAVISWDEAKKTYRFSGYTAQYGAMETTLDEGKYNTWIWGSDVPGGRMRYTIRLTKDWEWNEVGEFSADGAHWMKFFEMTLKK
jgi:hypothetical protein